MHHRKLTLSERTLIANWNNDGVKFREIARRLGRCHSTVVRELDRNKFHLGVYEPTNAQSKADKRKTYAWGAKHPLKSQKIFDYVTERLKRGWSPEAISGRLREVEHVGDKSWQICQETIYRFCYDQKNQKPGRKIFWWEYLRRKQKGRRKQHGRSVQRIRIPDRVSIHDRPGIIDKRKQFGHWEGDTVIGKGRNHGIHTAYERVSSLIRFEKMEDLTANSSYLAQLKIYQNLPPQARRTMTLDNGHEHVLHTRVKTELGIQSYFADPYSSWQRGGNENGNMWIRYYFPKGTDFRTIPDEDLRDVEFDLNSRPRKRLNYKTPLEVFTFHLVRS